MPPTRVYDNRVDELQKGQSLSVGAGQAVTYESVGVFLQSLVMLHGSI